MAKQPNMTLSQFARTINQCVREMKQLGRDPKTMTVLLSSDEEGNGYGHVDKRFSFQADEKHFIIAPVDQVML